jgi:AraC-like DNA-binding protein
MAREYGPRPEQGFRLLHGHHAPLPERTCITHVSESICGPDHAFDAHSHEAIEICYVLTGKGERIQSGRRLQVEAGDLCIAHPGERHAMHADGADPYHYFALAFRPDLLGIQQGPGAHAGQGDGGSALSARLPQEFQVLDQGLVHGLGGAEHILRRIIRELDHLEADPRLQELARIQLSLLVLELLVFSSRRLLTQAPVLTGAPDGRTPSRPAFVELIQWLQTRLASPPSLGEMAARVGLTASYFSVAFREELGQTPIAYVLALRAEAAARLLIADRSRPVSGIARELGFSTSQHFSQVFRAKTGMTPSQWREANPC